MPELDSFMKSFCTAGAEAVATYMRMSGMAATSIPEYFLSSLIFRAIGEAEAVPQAVTLETPWWQIHEWIQEYTPENRSDQRGSWKVDMLIYDGGGKPPDQQNIWAMVELKNGYIDADFIEGRRTDRDKLVLLSRKFKEASRPHLICCGAIHSLERREYHCKKAEEKGDRWFEAQVKHLTSNIDETHFFCARVIQDLAFPTLRDEAMGLGA